ncbi:MAG: tetratricopeptide repeat protein [Bryobacteraceae bacterium]
MSETIGDLLKQAVQERRENRLADARIHIIQAVDLCRQSAPPVDLAGALTRLGQIERDLENLDAARGHYEEAASLYRAEGDALRLAHTVRHVGDVLREQRRPDLAEACYQEALQIYRGDPQSPPLDLANAIRGLALLKDSARDTEPARLLWAEARDLYAAVDVKAGVTECNSRLSLLAKT